MSDSQKTKRGQRHPIVLHQALNEQNFWTCIVILVLSGGLLIWNPEPFAPYHLQLAVVLAGTGLFFILTFLFRLRSYVECRPDGLRIQQPFYRLTIPYRQIKGTRPTELGRLFPPTEQRWPQRRFLRYLWKKTVVALDLAEMPRRESWLRLWMSKYMLHPDEPGLVLPVRDWIALRNDLDDVLARHRRIGVQT